MPHRDAPLAKLSLARPLPGVLVTALDSAHHFPRHWHTSFGVGVVLKGAQRSRSGRGDVLAEAGDLITHNPGEVHDGQPVDGLSRRWMMAQFEPAALAALLGEPTLDALAWHQPVLARSGQAGRVHEALAQCLRDAEAVQRSGAAAEQQEALMGVLQAVMPLGAPLARAGRDPDGPLAHAALDRVKERLMCLSLPVPDLDELAALAGVTRYTLVRQFGRRHGLPPLAWQRHWRLEQGRQQLMRGARLADTAAALGFSDQSHFTRLFVSSFGYTPGRMHRALQGRLRGAAAKVRGATTF